MNISDYYASKVLERLQGLEEDRDRKFDRVMDLLDIDISEPGPEPEREDLVLSFGDAEERSGFLSFGGELDVLGQSVPLCFRVSYTGVHLGDEKREPEFVFTSHTEVLIWEADECGPRWAPLANGVFHTRAIRDVLEQLVNDNEAARTIDI